MRERECCLLHAPFFNLFVVVECFSEAECDIRANLVTSKNTGCGGIRQVGKWGLLAGEEGIVNTLEFQRLSTFQVHLDTSLNEQNHDCFTL